MLLADSGVNRSAGVTGSSDKIGEDEQLTAGIAEEKGKGAL